MYHRFPQRYPLVSIVALLCGLVLALGLLVAMFAIAGTSQNLEAEKSRMGRQKLRELRVSEQTRLNDYRWINKQEGQVGIPIDKAMELLLKEPNRFPEPVPAVNPPEQTEPNDKSNTEAEALP